jgi:hypothetical protein
MAIKQVLLVSLLISAALGAPSAKDLVTDVFQATRTVSYFDIEVNALSSRLYTFQSEINLQVVGYVRYIRTLLQNLQVLQFICCQSSADVQISIEQKHGLKSQFFH